MVDTKCVNRSHANDLLPQSNAHQPQRAGKVGWIILWLLGVPIPVLLILFVLRGCT